MDLCTLHGEKLSDATKNMIILYFFQHSEDEENKVLIEFAGRFQFLRKKCCVLLYIMV